MVHDAAPSARRERYDAELASPRWGGLRTYAFRASGGLCAYCWRRPATQLDHLDYDRLGHEGLDDVRPVCSTCHLWVSKARRDHAGLSSFLGGIGKGRALANTTGPVSEAWVLDYVRHALTRDPEATVVLDVGAVRWDEPRRSDLAGLLWVRFSWGLAGGIDYDVPDEVRPAAPPADYDARLVAESAEFAERCRVEDWRPASRRPLAGRPGGRTDRTRPSVARTSRRQYRRADR